MRIVVDGRAEIFGPDGTLLSAPYTLLGLGETELEAEELSLYLDASLADLGIVGGTTRLLSSPNSMGLRLQTTFYAPHDLNAEQQQRLLDDTIGQWQDGVGENGFNPVDRGIKIHVRFRPGEQAKVEQIDDPRSVPEPPAVAIAARDGHFEALKRALDHGADVNRRHQGYSPLHLAIIYGREREAVFLVENGADVNLTDKDGNTPLELCASANVLNDEQSARLASALLGRGARRDHVGENGMTAAQIAAIRKKDSLAQLLGG